MARNSPGIRLITHLVLAKTLEPRDLRCTVFSIRLSELPMPTGSTDPYVLTDWILESLGLIRRRGENGGLHRIMAEALLVEPLRGWDSKSLGEATGLSNTAVHQQIKKLRRAGLISTETIGKWDCHVLRGGSMFGAVSISIELASTVLRLRLSELSDMVEPSETRMVVPSEEDASTFSIRIAEPGPVREGIDRASSLVVDLGLSGEKESGAELASDILGELCSGHHPVTLMALSDRLSTTRGRVKTTMDRMRDAGLVESVPMVQRLSQDIFAALNRQSSARGSEWLMGRGGLSRLDDKVSSALLHGISNNDGIEAVEETLSPVSLEDQKILLNTLGGRLPFGYRLRGKDGKEISERVSRAADRSLRRIRTVAQRLDESLTT